MNKTRQTSREPLILECKCCGTRTIYESAERLKFCPHCGGAVQSGESTRQLEKRYAIDDKYMPSLIE